MTDFRGWLDSLTEEQDTFYTTLFKIRGKSRSQNYQDIFAYWVQYLNIHAYNPIAIEIGAADGLNGSNTFMLNRDYDWDCYLFEPNPEQYKKLIKNRLEVQHNFCFNDAIWDRTATVQFKMTGEPDLSTIYGYGESDEHAAKRSNNFKTVSVDAVTLSDFMVVHDLNTVTYISLDTEGSEYDILKAYFSNPFGTIHSFSIEHNYTSKRQDIFDLMTANGYRRVFEEVSRWDDFYVKF